MEEIIGLLIALAAIILKVVGKKLEKSAVSGTGNTEDSHEPSQDGPLDVAKWLEEVMKETQVLEEPAPIEEPQPVKTFEEAPRAVVQPAVDAVRPVRKTVKPVLLEEAQKETEKIDPKKLVVYSEIMKPKFKDEN